jgi:hypothetical protein
MTTRTDRLQLLWLFLIVLATSGCTATVSLMSEAAHAQAARFSPAPGKANVYVTRTSGLGNAVLFQVHFDGKLSGSIAPDTYLLFEVEPGTHQVAVLTQESQDAKVITVGQGQNFFVDVVPKFGWRYARAALEELTPEAGRKAVQSAKRAEGLTPQ